MIRQLFILLFAFLISITGSAQTVQPVPVDLYRNIPGVELVEAVSTEILTGGIRTETGFSGIYIKLDSTLSFRSIAYSCTEKNIVNRGTWSIFNNRMLELQSKNNRQIFDIVKYDSFYFFITPVDRRKFILALSKETNGQSAKSDFKLDGRYYSCNKISAHQLIQEFPGREITPNPIWEKTFTTH